MGYRLVYDFMITSRKGGVRVRERVKVWEGRNGITTTKNMKDTIRTGDKLMSPCYL